MSCPGSRSNSSAGNVDVIFAPSSTLEDAFELVPGDWVFEIWQGNRRLAMQVFKVITSTPDDGKVITSNADVSAITSTADCEACEGF